MQQNEHTIWLRSDRHAHAYQTLLDERSRSIARNLGLDRPAHEADECLDCHSDNAAERRATHRLEEGVSCEACHGGAERWLKTHTLPTRTHAANLADGMYPTDHPLARAELCISCHLGSAERFVSHRMMGAGHPRLSFELDSFGLGQPPHFQVDDDYLERGKATPPSVRLWALGQAVLAREQLAILADPRRNRDGIWPEFAVLDCFTCHHEIGERRRAPRADTGLATHPGTPRMNDSTLLMLIQIASALESGQADLLRDDLRALHAGVSRGAGDRAVVAARLKERVDAICRALESWEPDARALRRILNAMLADGRGGAYRDYPAAEQAMQGVQALVDSIHRLEPFEHSELDSLQQAFDALATATRDPDRFSPDSFQRALRQLDEPLG